MLILQAGVYGARFQPRTIGLRSQLPVAIPNGRSKSQVINKNFFNPKFDISLAFLKEIIFRLC